jgi:hypothetical protein
MANDTDMWQDIEDLESNPETKRQSEDLLELYVNRYIEHNPDKLEYLKKEYEKKYGHLDNYI